MSIAVTRTEGGGNAATILGLALALGLPLLLVPTGLLSGFLSEVAPKDGLVYVLLRESFFWVLTLAVLFVLTIAEGQPLAAIGLGRVRWSTLLWALLGFVAAFLSYPVGAILLKAVGGTMPVATFSRFAGLPLWLLALVVLRAGVCEEILFRGYAISRLTALSGSRVVGAVLPGLAFMALHIEGYGPTYAVFLIPLTTVITIQYVWRRDLWSNILTHLLVDGVALTMTILSVRG
jgi:membrane protease YdiL (CAAX protease family)